MKRLALKPQIIFFLLTTAAFGILLSGCSMLASEGGKRVERVLDTGKSAVSIRKSLGTPVQQVNFSTVRPASEIPELIRLSRYRRELSLRSPIAGYEDYEFKGRVYSPEKYAGYAMVSTFTLGAGEVLLFPALLSDIKKDSQTLQRFRVWYQPDQTYFAHVWSGDHWAKNVLNAK